MKNKILLIIDKIKKLWFKYHKIIIVVSILLFIIISIIINNIPKHKKIINDEKEKTQEILNFNVKVKGEVKSPKNLSFDKEIYLYEIILLCDGFTEYSDISNINLIEKINKDKEIIILKQDIKEDNNIYIIDISKDNNIVYIYLGRINGKINIYKASKKMTLYEILWMVDIDLDDYQDEVIEYDKNYVRINNGLININNATLEELMTLDNIGKSTAQKIIDYRNTNGPFTKIEDIMKVSGIKEATFLLIKDKICV